MKLDDLFFNPVPVTMVLLLCPKCSKAYKVELADFSEANRFMCGYRCVDCGTGFIAELKGLTRAVEQRDEAAGEGAGETPNSLRTEDH